MPDVAPTRGLLDTSVLIGLEQVDPRLLPEELSVSTLSMAELAAGPHAAQDAAERARRQDRLQRVEAAFEAVPFDAAAARAYGRVAAAVLARGRQPRGARVVDLLIAATALAQDMSLLTRNPEDLRGLESLVDVIAV